MEAATPPERPARPRVAVVIPTHGEGRLLAEAVDSIREAEPVEIVVVDDASPDAATRAVIQALSARGDVQVVRLPENRGVAVARTEGLRATAAPLVYPLDADDLALPGVLGAMADALERDAGAVACVGDIREFGSHELVRAVPERLDPYRLAYTNEYPVTALFRRSALERAGGWCRFHEQEGYEDWDLWMTLAEDRARIVHLGRRRPGYARRLHGIRLGARAKRRHGELYPILRARHPHLFAALGAHRRATDLGVARRLLYPMVYGMRAGHPLRRRFKPVLDRLGIWTHGRH